VDEQKAGSLSTKVNTV